MIRVNSLSKQFGRFQAVADISFEVQRGEVLGFLGPNGAGKSTTMRMLTCYLPPSSGSAEVNGFSILDQLHHTYKHMHRTAQAMILTSRFLHKD